MKVEYVSCQSVLIEQSMIYLEGQEVLAKTLKAELDISISWGGGGSR